MGVRTTGYDPQSNVTSESDERNVTTSYVYNGFGEPIQEASPDGGTIVTVRDPAGNVTQKTDARGQVSQSSYDALNRVTATNFAGAADANRDGKLSWEEFARTGGRRYSSAVEVGIGSAPCGAGRRGDHGRRTRPTQACRHPRGRRRRL